MSKAPSDQSAAAARSIFESTKMALERAPVLRTIFERLAGEYAESMRAICAPPCTFMLNSVVTGTVWDLIENYESGICSVCLCPEWDTWIIIGFDRRFTFSLVDASFGGDGTEASYESERPFSMMETRLAKEAFLLAAETLKPLLQVIDTTSVVLERMEGRLDFSTIGVPDVPALMAQLVGQVLDGGGGMFVIIPNSGLVPFRRRLEKERSPEPTYHDPEWGMQLLGQISQSSVELRAVLSGSPLSIDEIMRFQVGQIIPLETQIDGLVSLESLGKSMFNCKIGKSQGSFTAQIVSRDGE